MAPHLVICGIGSGMDRSLPLVRGIGFRLTVITDTVTPLMRQTADQVVPVYPRDLAKVTAAVTEAGVRGADGVLSLGYENPPVIAELTARLGGYGIDLETALNCTRKDRRIAILHRAGVRVARHAIAEDAHGALAGLEQVGYPAVVKPVDLTSSLGVTKLDNPANAVGLVEQALLMSPAGRVIVEEFLVGTEHTVEGVCQDGQLHVTAFSDRNYADEELFAPYFFENGDTLPSALAPGVQVEIIAVVTSAVAALALDPAVFSCDVLLTAAGEVVLLEVAGRMAGSRFGTEVVPLSTGVNVLPSAVRLAVGDRLRAEELTPRSSRPVVLRYRPAMPGVVQSVGELPTEPADPRVYDLFWENRPSVGDRLDRYRSGKDMIAGVIVTDRSIASAEEVARRTLYRLPLVIAEDASTTGGGEASHAPPR